MVVLEDFYNLLNCHVRTAIREFAWQYESVDMYVWEW